MQGIGDPGLPLLAGQSDVEGVRVEAGNGAERQDIAVGDVHHDRRRAALRHQALMHEALQAAVHGED